MLHPGLRTVVAAGFLVALILTPSFYSMLGTTGAVLPLFTSTGVAFAALALAGFRVPLGDGIEWRIHALIGCILTAYLAHILFATWLFNPRIVARDLIDVYRPAWAGAAYCIGILVYRERTDFDAVVRILLLLFAVCAVLAAIQITRVADPFAELFTKTHNVLTRRATIPFNNPYDLGYFAVFVAALCAGRLLASLQWRYVALVGLTMAVLMATQSRTALFGLAVFVATLPFAIGAAAILRTGNRTPLRRVMARYLVFAVPAAGMVVALALTFQEGLQYMLRIVDILAGADVYSVTVRAGQMQDTLDSAGYLTLLFGNGVSKGYAEFLESIYAYHVSRFGLVGLVLYFMVPLAVGIVCLGAWVRSRDTRMIAMGVALAAWFAVLPAISVGSNFTEQPRLGALFYFTLALIVRGAFQQGSAGTTSRASLQAANQSRDTAAC